jgi:hypothetical protein
MSSTAPTGSGTAQRGSKPANGILGWIVSALLVLGGTGFAVAGALFTRAAGGTLVADLVAAGRLQSAELAPAELIAVTNGLLWWGGVGLAVVGGLMLVGGMVLAIAVFRAGRETGDSRLPATGVNAVVGAVVTLVTGFVPLSPIIGGAVAGYLGRGSRSEGVRTGAIAGLFASMPVVVLFAFLIGGSVAVATELGLGAVGAIVALGLVVGLLGAVVYTVALGAVGGYLGAGLGSRRTGTEYREDPAA